MTPKAFLKKSVELLPQLAGLLLLFQLVIATSPQVDASSPSYLTDSREAQVTWMV
ncbi:MAG: hypothetical protein RLW62_18450 [Gammaproteobacteria bacterium]